MVYGNPPDCRRVDFKKGFQCSSRYEQVRGSNPSNIRFQKKQTMAYGTGMGIAGGWCLAWGLICGWVLTPEADDDNQLATRLQALIASVALIWAGMVLGISFLEAWLKFGAPLLTRPVALDVGRRVFRGLNSAEIVHCSVLDALYIWLRRTLVRIPGRVFRPPGARAWGGFPTGADWIPVVLTAFVGCQSAWLTPKLTDNALWCIATADQSEFPSSRAAYQKDACHHIRSEEFHGRRPKLHLLYILMECAKLGLLVAISTWALSAMQFNF